MKKESKIRSVFKGLSWRFIATATTITVAYFVTGDIQTGLQIGALEFLIKFLVYYFHERIWQFAYKDGVVSKLESLMKTLSWRVVASTTTGLISYFIIAEGAGSQALTIVMFEASTKMLLYYLHERIWLKVPLGTFRRIFTKRNSSETA